MLKHQDYKTPTQFTLIKMSKFLLSSRKRVSCFTSLLTPTISTLNNAQNEGRDFTLSLSFAIFTAFCQSTKPN